MFESATVVLNQKSDDVVPMIKVPNSGTHFFKLTVIAETPYHSVALHWHRYGSLAKTPGVFITVNNDDSFLNRRRGCTFVQTTNAC